MSTATMCAALTNSSWEAVAATAPGGHFFQLYVFGDREWIGEILDRVEAAGFAAICVTVDAPAIGRRDRSLEQGFTWQLPPGGPANLTQHGWDHESFRSRFTWTDLQWLCERTELPVVIKGVMTPEDSLAAVECGVAGVYVSNHGGRMVDHGLSTIEVLGDIVEALPGDVDVAIDGGFTRGAEVCKALALGANAVGIGRLQCWGLAVGGTPGLIRVLEILREEISVTMANIGCRRVDEIGPGHVRWSMPASPPGSG
jgi:isopentenyl diphosphate isomerase/L-lactate dehydrogenase-like FMN-dependent dehydrogenase